MSSDTPTRGEFRALEYPGLHDGASRASASGQRFYTRLVAAQIVFPLIGAAIAVALPGRAVSVPLGILFLIALAASLFMQFRRPEREWFQGRVIAESLKRMAWEYAMRVPPYDAGDENEAREELKKRVRELVPERSDWSWRMGLDEPRPTVTESMTNTRGLDWKQRQSLYVDARLRQQSGWYRTRARQNDDLARRWLWLVSLLQLGGLMLAFLRAAGVDIEMFGLISAATGGAMAWLQSKRHQELAQSYGFAATELHGLDEEFKSIASSEDLVKRVRESEDAISREHIAWVAKRL